MIDGAGSQSYVYDLLNRLTTLTRGLESFTYAYDAAGNVISRTYPGAATASYAYDDDGNLATVTNDGATTTYGYDANSNLLSKALPTTTGYSELRQYDHAGRLTRVSNEQGSGILSRFDYSYDANGNPTAVTTPTGVTTYAYDNRDRLRDVCFQSSCAGGGDPFIRYAYDAVGNVTSEVRPSGTTAYTYNTGDELTSTDGPSGTTSYSYDPNGNEVQAGGRTLSYNLANRLASTTSGTTTSYSYDGDGNRLQASSGSANSDKTNYLWDVNMTVPQLALERDGSGSAIRSYFYGANAIGFGSGGSSFYYQYDGLGSVVNVTSASGTTEWSYAYEPFGDARTATQNDPSAPDNPIRFAGELRDPTGFYDLRARQYDPTSFRFLSLDPLAQSTSLPAESAYVYAGNEPTAFIDPSGTGRVWGMAGGGGYCSGSWDPICKINGKTFGRYGASCLTNGAIGAAANALDPLGSAATGFAVGCAEGFGAELVGDVFGPTAGDVAQVAAITHGSTKLLGGRLGREMSKAAGQAWKAALWPALK